MKRFKLNQSGMTVAQVMIAAGLMAILAAAFSQMIIQQNHAINALHANLEHTAISTHATQTLIKPNECVLNFGGLDPNVENELQAIVRRGPDGNPVPVMQLAPAVYGNGTLQFDSFIFGGPGSNPGPNPNPGFVVDLQILSSRAKTALGSTNMPRKTIKVYASTDAAGNINSCTTDHLGGFSEVQLENDGYVVFPNGFMIQWGRATAQSNGQTTVVFEREFETKPFSITVSGTMDNGTNAKDNWPTLYRHPASTTTTSFQIHSSNDSDDRVSWMAFGMVKN